MIRPLHPLFALACALALAPAWAAAQGGGVTITGRVTSEAGVPLPNASVFVQGTTLGTLVKDDGSYTLPIPAERATGQSVTLTARLIGYKAQTAQITLSPGTITQNFILTANPTQLQAVVTTALGIQKQRSQLGTAEQQLSSSELNSTHDQNILNQLEGKVSGVEITGSGTQGGSTNIVIRGSNSINGNNQPLFIVDGIPIANNDKGGSPNGGGLATGNGLDVGSTISDLNPDDIATVSILKGPNAAALYGSRAANGVIIITTKQGAASSGRIQTQFNSSYTWDHPSILPDYQNLYGQGSAGQFSFVDGAGGGVNDGDDQSYGPKMDGRLINQFTGPNQPWVAHPDNVSSFFNTGHTFTNTLAVSGGTENANARLSVGDQNVTGIIPNNSFRRLNASLNGSLRLGNRLHTSANLAYVQNQGQNRPGVGYNTGILEQFVWFGRQVDMNVLRAKQLNPDGSLFNWNYNYHNNPFWLQDYNPETDRRDRVIASGSATYTITNWLNATLRGGEDYYRMNENRDFAAGNLNYADPNYSGAFSFYNEYNSENNTELLLTANKQVSHRLVLNGLAGANRRYTEYSNGNIYTSGISVPGIYSVSNAAITPTLAQFQSARQVNSVYGSASFTWDNWWTVEGTARNDWSSTLPRQNDSYFYPGVNTSIVLTDAIPSLKSNVLSYIKLRGAYARVGNDADPYQLLTTYNGVATKFGSLPQYTLSDLIANSNLKPELTTSGEGGAEVGLFNSRLTFDISYYDKKTTNQIIDLVVSPASGFTTKALNAGEIQNKGFEALVSATPIRTGSGFEWNTSFNFARNRSKVVSLYPGLTSIVLGSAWNANLEARVGQPYGDIYGYTFLRDSAGNLLLQNGLPQQGKLAVLGNVQPNWVGGWNNDFHYKRYSLSFLFDIREGGDIFSITNMMGDQSGVLARTLYGRTNDWDNPGIVVKGIDQATGKPNTVRVTSEEYFQGLWEIHQQYIYDDSWIKLREVRFGIDLPESIASRLAAQRVNLAFVGRNLWTHTKVPNIDPEFSYTTGNFQGFEFAPLPTPKSFGINLSVTP